ncbi:MAG: agmatine deiminase family protein [Clostridiales bacterium]
MVIEGIPKELNYRVPAEWDKHKFTLMAWPVVEADWPGSINEIYDVFSDTVRKILKFEHVKIIVKPHLIDQCKNYCGQKVDFITIENDDSWIRDSGPVMLKNDNKKTAGLNWKFNAWGGKYPYEKDNLISPKVMNLLKIPYFDIPIIMEGGSIDTDGEGTALTTKECLLNKNRNPKLSIDDIEDVIKKYYNIKKVIWLEKGLYGDDTDGHIDNLACFVKPGLLMLQVCYDKSDPDYERTMENIRIIKNSVDALGRSIEIIEIEKPKISYYNDMLLTLSYINFYFVNNGIILPLFDSKNEKTNVKVYDILKSLFPERKIETIEGSVLARGGGNIHCLTQQFPK